jgi:purine-nucleoside phosphorylase
MTAFDAFARTVSALAPRTAVVLGSGLAGATAAFVERASVGFGTIPGLVPPTVHGHGGKLAVGEWAGVPALLFLGRLHFYEGHPWQVVTGTVRTVANLGAKRIVLTNAAGGIHPALKPGDLMALRGHLKLLGANAWRELAKDERGASSLTSPPEGEVAGTAAVPAGGGCGKEEAPTLTPHPPRPPSGPRRPPPQGGRSEAAPYSSHLLNVLNSHERVAGRELLAGVYAALTGPSYETPAEIRALTAMGADAVGMSTAMEAEEAARLGLEVAGISCITNKAAGLGGETLGHAEVLVNAKLAVKRMGELLGRLVGERVA